MNHHCVNRILKCLIYIEENLDSELRIEELAQMACYSPFHFQRVFYAIVGESVHKYIRRLRVEQAATQLRYTNNPITDIAGSANFDTSSSFAKAFKICMGTSPRNYRLLFKEVDAMKNKIKALVEIQPQDIITMNSIEVLFVRRIGDYEQSSQEAWDEMIDFIHTHHIDRKKLRYFSLVHDDPEITLAENLRFDACIATNNLVSPKTGLSTQVIDGGRYGVFIHYGSHETIAQTYDRIFLKWLPDALYEFDGQRINFCEHFNLEYVHHDPIKLVTRIYIPLIIKVK